MAALRAYHWPGNVRELRHVIEEGAVLATGGVIGREHLTLIHAGQEVAPAASLEQQLAVICGTLFNQHPGNVHQRLWSGSNWRLFASHGPHQWQSIALRQLLGINRITLKSASIKRRTNWRKVDWVTDYRRRTRGYGSGGNAVGIWPGCDHFGGR